MKKLLTSLVLLFIIPTAFCQSGIGAINGFKYAYVGLLTYQNSGQDIYGVTAYLRNELSKKGLIVLDYNNSHWPQEAKDNPCLIGVWLPSHQPGGLNSAKAGYIIKNCKNDIVYQNFETASHFGYYYNGNVPLAMEKAFKPIQSFRYNFDETATVKVDYPQVETTNETEQSLKAYFDANKLDAIEGIYKSYQSDVLTYYKFAIIKSGQQYKAIIIESALKQWKPGEVKAYFEPSSMQGVFSIKWLMGNKTAYESFATMENEGILSIELKNPSTNEKTQDKFVKMYPTAISGVVTNANIPKASGSGFFMSPNGIIATNAHVVDNANKIEVIISNELGTFTYKAKPLLKDSKNDVALIQIEDPSYKELTALPYTVNDKTDIGEKVFTIGYPLNEIMGTNCKLSDGIISASTGIGDDVRYYQISVPLQPGNSGGPLFDKDGSIVGITSARLNGQAVGTLVENVNYAIKITYLLNLYNMLPNAVQLPTSSKLTGKQLQDQFKTLKNYVCIIKIY